MTSPDGGDLQMAEDRAQALAPDVDGRHRRTFPGHRHAHADVETLCLAAAKQFAHRYGFAVKSLKLELTNSTRPERSTPN